MSYSESLLPIAISVKFTTVRSCSNREEFFNDRKFYRHYAKNQRIFSLFARDLAILFHWGMSGFGSRRIET